MRDTTSATRVEVRRFGAGELTKRVMQMEIGRADVWCGNDRALRDRMEQLGLLVPDAQDLSDFTDGDLHGRVIGGEAPPWSRLPFCAGVIERVPPSKAGTDVNRVEGFACYAIHVMDPLPALLSSAQIDGIVSRISPDETATLRDQLVLQPDLPVWTEPRKKDIHNLHIAVAGEVPLGVAMWPDSCTMARAREAGPGQRDIEPFTLKVEWGGFRRA